MKDLRCQHKRNARNDRVYNAFSDFDNLPKVKDLKWSIWGDPNYGNVSFLILSAIGIIYFGYKIIQDFTNLLAQ